MKTPTRIPDSSRTTSVVTLLWAILALAASASGEDRSKDVKLLERGTRLNFRVKKPQSLAKVLEHIAKKTGNTITIHDDYGGADEKALSTKARFDFRKKTFWEALAAIQKEAGTQFLKQENGQLILTTDDGTTFGQRNKRPGAPPIYLGAFQLTPSEETSWDRFFVSVLSEPRFDGTALGAATASAQMSDGSEVQLEVSSRSGRSLHSGALEIHFEKTKDRKRKESKKIQHIDFEATLLVPLDRKEADLGALGELVARPQKRGKAIFRVVQAAVEPVDRESEGRLVVRLTVLGREVEASKIRLIDAGGKKIKPTGTGSSSITRNKEVSQSVRLEFPAELAASLAKCSLALGSKKSKPLKLSEKYVSKLVEIGGLSVRVIEASRTKNEYTDSFRVGLEVQGGQIPVQSVKLFAGKKELEPVGWSSSSNGITRSFEPSAVKGDGRSLRLRVTAPTSTVRHTISAKIENPDLTFK